ncbi:MAG TPA: hypothetical protein VOA64_17940 [Candidatus Dormibacteraeota bacterium]|nr:hypothetical protein [Candidatus Dormibacteraeota bacterium]
MKSLKHIVRLNHCVVLILLATGWGYASQEATPTSPSNADAAGIKEFSDRAQEFVKLHHSVEAKLPKLKTTDVPELIVAHEQALARKIREARPHAKRGDIFTPNATEAFRNAIQKALAGPEAPHAKATIKQGDPLAKVRLLVNRAYPKALPYTTVPPTLLLNLPKLPNELAYRVAGHDLVLLDVKANLVVDYIPIVIP